MFFERIQLALALQMPSQEIKEALSHLGKLESGQYHNRTVLQKSSYDFIYLFFTISYMFLRNVSVSCEIAPRWISFDPSIDKSILVQVMAWCRQATSVNVFYKWENDKCHGSQE